MSTKVSLLLAVGFILLVAGGSVVWWVRDKMAESRIAKRLRENVAALTDEQDRISAINEEEQRGLDANRQGHQDAAELTEDELVANLRESGRAYVVSSSDDDN